MGIKAVKLLFHWLVVLSGVAGLAMAIVVYLAHKVEPEANVWFQFAAMISPFIILFNIVLFIYWTVKKRVYLLIPLTAIAISFNLITNIVGSNFFKSGSSDSASKKIVVSTYNVNYFSYSKEINAPGIAKIMYDNKVDVLAMQEFEPGFYFNLDELKGEFGYLPYYAINLDEGAIGMAIFSKYPILRSMKIGFKETGNGALWADINVNGDTVRFICNHLQTTSYYSAYGYGASYLIKKMAANYKKRAQQVKIIRSLIDTTKFPLVVFGDFNDTPRGYVYSAIQEKGMEDCFSKANFQLGGTYLWTFGLIRIDYIFHDKFFKTLSYKRIRSDLSDHRPIISELEFTK
jgi:endonuclease/exonuclease/phosphatase family metal-dependent hydrolase